MTLDLQNSLGSTQTIISIAPEYHEEVSAHLAGRLNFKGKILEGVEDDLAFEMEAHLEEFLVRNWNQTDLAKKWDIYEENGEIIGKQYQTDTGPLDILAISKDKKSYLVVELKRGRAGDEVVGQILRYMSYIKEEVSC
jgi:restriction system protein